MPARSPVRDCSMRSCTGSPPLRTVSTMVGGKALERARQQRGRHSQPEEGMIRRPHPNAFPDWSGPAGRSARPNHGCASSARPFLARTAKAGQPRLLPVIAAGIRRRRATTRAPAQTDLLVRPRRAGHRSELTGILWASRRIGSRLAEYPKPSMTSSNRMSAGVSRSNRAESCVTLLPSRSSPNCHRTARTASGSSRATNSAHTSPPTRFQSTSKP